MVQMGSQHRSEPYQLAVRDIVRSGRIGEIVHIEQEWNVNQERWRFVDMDTGISAEMEQDRNMEWKKWLYERPSKLREEDTDWKRWLLGKPYRPFDPHVYLEFRLYKDYSSGIFDQWMSHGSDLVHFWTDESVSGECCRQRWNLRVERWPRESGYLRCGRHLSQGISLYLQNHFREQLQKLLPDPGARWNHRKLRRRRRFPLYGEQRRRQTRMGQQPIKHRRSDREPDGGSGRGRKGCGRRTTKHRRARR